MRLIAIPHCDRTSNSPRHRHRVPAGRRVRSIRLPAAPVGPAMIGSNSTPMTARSTLTMAGALPQGALPSTTSFISTCGWLNRLIFRSPLMAKERSSLWPIYVEMGARRYIGVKHENRNDRYRRNDDGSNDCQPYTLRTGRLARRSASGYWSGIFQRGISCLPARRANLPACRLVAHWPSSGFVSCSGLSLCPVTSPGVINRHPVPT